jgi:hypothetical protein
MADSLRLTECYHAEFNVIGGLRNLDDLSAFCSLNPNLHTLGFICTVEV